MTPGLTLPDPTHTLFADVEDATKYRLIHNVPLFTDFKAKRKDPETGELQDIDVDDEKIKEAVAQQNLQEQKRKGLPVITPGHRLKDPKVPESKQPPPWGWSKGWKFAKRDGKPVILGTLCLKTKPVADDSGTERRWVVPSEEVDSYPFRSPEYYAGSGEITGIALLRRDPQLELGVLSCWRDCGNEVTLFAAGDIAMETPSTPPTPSSPSAKPSSPSTPPSPSADPTKPPQAMAPGAEDSEKFMACMKHHMPHLQALNEHMAKGGHPMHFMMPEGGEMAPETPPSKPGEKPAEPPVGAPPMTPSAPETMAKQVEDAVRMAREEAAVQFNRLQQEVAVERGKREAAEKATRRKRYEQMVTQLDAEGFLIPDRVKEVNRFAESEETVQDERAAEIRSCFQRDITKLPYVHVAQTDDKGQPVSGGKATTEEQCEAVDKKRVAMSRELGKHVSFEEAEAAFFGVKQ